MNQPMEEQILKPNKCAENLDLLVDARMSFLGGRYDEAANLLKDIANITPERIQHELRELLDKNWSQTLELTAFRMCQCSCKTT